MIRRAVFWSFTTQIATFVVQFGSSIIMARLLAPVELGVFAVAIAIMGIVQLFVAFGLGNYIIREEKVSDSMLHTAFTINAILSCGLALIIFASSFISAAVLKNESVAQVLRLLSVIPLTSIISFGPNAMLQRNMEMRGLSILGTSNAILTSAITIGAALAGCSSMSFAYGSVAGSIFYTLGTLVVGRSHLKIGLSLAEWRPITAFGLRMMSIGGISSAAMRVSDIILGYVLGLSALGLYSRAANLNNMIFSNVYGAATRVVFAKLAEALRDGDRVGEIYIRGYRIIVAIMAPMLLGLAIMSRPVISILYGSRWLEAALPFSLLIMGQFVSLTFAMNWELFVVRDELKAQTRLEVTRSLMGIVTQTIGAMFSLTMAASASIVNNALSFVIYQKYMPRLAKTTHSVFYRAYGEALFLGMAAALPPFLLMIFYHWSPATPLILMVAATIVGGLLWLWRIIVSHHPVLDEINIVIEKLVGRRYTIGRPMES